jgi:hypothetical protein
MTFPAIISRAEMLDRTSSTTRLCFSFTTP